METANPDGRRIVLEKCEYHDGAGRLGGAIGESNAGQTAARACSTPTSAAATWRGENRIPISSCCRRGNSASRPTRCVVVEDAPAGVEAAKAGGMRAIGVARLDDAEMLAAGGRRSGRHVARPGRRRCAAAWPAQSARSRRCREADRDGEEALGRDATKRRWIEEAFVATAEPGWVLRGAGYDTTREAGIEARFAIGNGFLGVRGSRVDQSRADVDVVPATSELGLLAAHLCRRPVRYAEHRAAGARPGSRARLAAGAHLVDGELALIRSGTCSSHRRCARHAPRPAADRVAPAQPSGRVLQVRTLRFVSQADRALGLQDARLSNRRTGRPRSRSRRRSRRTGSRSSAFPRRRSVAVWRTAQSAKTLAMASTRELRLDGSRVAAVRRPDALNRLWSWTSEPGRAATLLRTVAFARGDGRRTIGGGSALAALDRGAADPAGAASSPITSRPGRSAGPTATSRSKATPRRSGRCASPSTT